MQANRIFVCALIVACTTVVLAAGLHRVFADPQPKSASSPQPRCKLTPVEAMSIAVKKVQGKPLNANFEFGEGHWVYAVMVVHGKEIKEVEIDPMTGKVGDVEAVTPDGEAKEIKSELTKALGG